LSTRVLTETQQWLDEQRRATGAPIGRILDELVRSAALQTATPASPR
jgi:hypothetical protein